MIRINLLETSELIAGSSITESRFFSGRDPQRNLTIISVLVFGLFSTLIGFQLLSSYNQGALLDQAIGQLNQEKARLAPIIAQVADYQAKLIELEKKERLIERLKSEREGPVRMLDVLSDELPDFVWLTELGQDGSSVTIDGMAASLSSVADYIRKLEDSEWFQGVELVNAEIDSRQEQDFTQFQLQTELISSKNNKGNKSVGLSEAESSGRDLGLESEL